MNFLSDAQQSALGFLEAQVRNIEAEVFEVQYPDIQYPTLVPVTTEGNEWAIGTTFYSMDMVGQAEWFHHNAGDMPRANVNREQHTHDYHMAGIGYGYTLEELGQVMMVPGTNLSADRARAANRAAEEFLDGVALNGNTAKSWKGLINSDSLTGLTVATAAATGTGSATDWANKTPDNILQDVNDLLTGQWTASKNIELSNTVLLPYAEIARLVSVRLTDSQISILDYLKRSNIYTNQSGQELMIRGVRGLETGGADGSGRMVAYRRDPEVMKFHMPMPHRFFPVWQTGPMRFDIPGAMRTGGLEIRRPGAVRYMDGIIDNSGS